MIYNLAKITDVASIVSGNTPSGIDDLYEDNGEIPFFRVSDMNSFGNEIWMNSSTNSLSIENAKKLKLKICEAGTVIFPKRGGAIFTNKKRILSKPSTYDLNTMGLVPNEKVQTKYFFYWFNSLDLSSLADGSSVPQLNNKQILPLQIPLPPLPQQQKIANILDVADALRQNDKALLAKYDELTQALFLDMFGDPVSNPKGWEIKPLGKICKIQGGYSFKSTDFVKSGVKLVKIANVNFQFLDWEDVDLLPMEFIQKHSNFSLNEGDILMALTRPIIKSLGSVKAVTVKKTDLPALLNQRVARFFPKTEVLSRDFLLRIIYSNFFKNKIEKFSSTSLQPNVSNKQVENIEIFLPPLELQNQFAERVAVIEEQKAIAQKSLEKSESLFNSLLQKAFKGELV